MSAIRVLIADDHPLIVVGLRTTLSALGMKVVGEESEAERVVDAYAACAAEVVVLDIRFGDGLGGLEIARELLRRHPQARVVFYSQFDQDEIIKEAYRIGCAAFVTKVATPQELADAIREAHAGRTTFMRDIAARLALAGLRGERSPIDELEPRERDVFLRMARGMTNPEIATQMDLSLKTISTVTQSIKEKLGVTRPAEITRIALRYKLIEP